MAVFLGPEPVVPDNLPEHVKVKARRYAACEVQIASAGFDHKLGVDRVKFSYRMGWEDNGQFVSTAHIPDERVAEFIEALQKAAANAKVAHSNAVKSAKGTLTSTLEKQLSKAAGKVVAG